METNVLKETCYYCGKEATNKSDYYEQDMYYITSRAKLAVGYNYETKIVHIPRCKECRTKQDKFFLITFPPMILIIAAVIFSLLYFKTEGWELWLVLVVGIASSIMVSSFLFGIFGGAIFKALYKISPPDDNTEYEPIKTLINQGWKTELPDAANAQPSKPKEKNS